MLMFRGQSGACVALLTSIFNVALFFFSCFFFENDENNYTVSFMIALTMINSTKETMILR